MAVKDKKRRLFFALWPSAKVRQAIAETAGPLLHEMDARIIAPENFHITLHFIGSVTDAEKDCLHQAARKLAFQPFDFSLDCFGFFDKAKIFWMGMQVAPTELSRLYENLGEALSACDYQPDPRPYSPHVSLLRKAGKVPVEYQPFSISWHVDEFVLVESVSSPEGVNYKVIEKYPLPIK